MVAVLLKALSFVFIIVLGYILKKKRFFKPTDYRVITKITMNITLPAAVITAFSNFEKDNSIFMLVVLGFGMNLLMLGIGYVISRKKEPEWKALYMLNLPGYNIGAFTMPFVQNFLGPLGVVATCMFDAGNAIMCTGGSYTLTYHMVKGKGRLDFRSLAKRLLSSAPFDTYVIMLFISILGLKIPGSMIKVISTVALANGFCAMLMIGMMFEIRFEAKHLKAASTILILRFLAAGLCSAACYYLTPFSLMIRQVLSIIVFAPVSGLTPVFTEMCGGDSGLSSFISSLSILISIAVMTTLIIVMGIGI